MSEIVVNRKVKQPARDVPFLLRVIWFFVLGWELTGAWILVAWFLNITIIGLPLGLWMIDRVPQVLTLKARPGAWVVDVRSGRTRFVLNFIPAWDYLAPQTGNFVALIFSMVYQSDYGKLRKNRIRRFKKAVADTGRTVIMTGLVYRDKLCYDQDTNLKEVVE